MIIGIDGNEANVASRVGSGTYAFELLNQFQKSKKHKFVIYLKEKPQSDFPSTQPKPSLRGQLRKEINHGLHFRRQRK